jgi:hypothetical protein
MVNLAEFLSETKANTNRLDLADLKRLYCDEGQTVSFP